MNVEDYIERDATALAEGVRRGDWTPSELFAAAASRLESVNPSLNAVVFSRLEEGRQEAAAADGGKGEAPFSGVPFLIKNLMSWLKGHPCTSGSRLMEGWAPPHDSSMVARWKQAGLIIAGSTNSPEWGLLPVTEPKAHGPSRNPWDLDRTPGGSSGGSGAAVAAGIVPMAGAGDGGGSIRIPASCCGLFGLKPTRGRTPSGPDRPLPWRGMAIEHVVTRSVRDSAALLDATHGFEAGGGHLLAAPEQGFLSAVARDPRSLKIAWTDRPLLHQEVDGECLEGLQSTVALLGELGHEVHEVSLPFDGETFARSFLTVLAAELAAEFRHIERETGRKAGPGKVEAEAWALSLVARAHSAVELNTALRHLERSASNLAAHLSRWDLLLSPTLASPPVRIGEMATPPGQHLALNILGRLGSGRLLRWAGLLEEAAAEAFRFTPWTPVFNATGQPAMSVPLHMSRAGLPVGMHFVGPVGGEETLLSLAGQLERARPWPLVAPEGGLIGQS